MKTATIGAIANAGIPTLELLPLMLEYLPDEPGPLQHRAYFFTSLAPDQVLSPALADELHALVMEIEDELNSTAPPYVMFGQQGFEGDWGWWPDLMSLEDAAGENDSDCLKVSQVPTYLMQVSDHGNVTLYEVTVKEVWSVV